MKSTPLLIILFAAALADYKSYEGYTVYQVIPLTNQDSDVLQDLYNTNKFDFWSTSKAINHTVSIMVSPDRKSMFVSAMEKHNLSYRVQIENVETTIAAERFRQAKKPRGPQGRITYDAFYTYDEIWDHITTLQAANSDIMEIEPYGQSFEDRDLKLVRIGTDPPDDKPTIFIEAAIHAREWIAPPVVVYAIEQLIDPDNIEMVENANWILIPVTNPDGYEFTHTYDRLWRKTRSTGIICNGVDGNRNFEYQWGGLGSSTGECEQTFRGLEPHSEPEVQALVDVALAEDRIDLYLAVHSYGNYLVYPWGYTLDLPSSQAELQAAGQAAADAIAAIDDTEYTVGSTANLMYFASGISSDWFYAETGATLSYTLELPGGSEGGFVIDPARIQDIVSEVWPGIVALYEQIPSNP